MKKVGIVTFHYINNYGAILQAYALKKAIDKLDGYTAEIINYIPENRVEYPYEYGEVGKKLMEKKLAKLYGFLWENCDVNREIVRSVKGNNYDYYCVGSDQVWNFDISGNDYTYLLKDVSPEARKISYASSLGLSIERLMPYKDVFRKYLSDFSAVSVRESVHQRWLQEYCGVECETVLDPTFLLNGFEYETIISETKLTDHPYVLFIWYIHDKDLIKGIEFANTVARKYSLRIIHNIVNAKDYMIAHNEKCMFYGGIEDFLWYIKNAAFIVTNSYHVTLFCLHFRRPFYSFVTENMRSRFDAIGEYARVKNRFVESYIEPNEINDLIDFEMIEKCLYPMKRKSIEYIQRVLYE